MFTSFSHDEMIDRHPRNELPAMLQANLRVNIPAIFLANCISAGKTIIEVYLNMRRFISIEFERRPIIFQVGLLSKTHKKGSIPQASGQ